MVAAHAPTSSVFGALSCQAELESGCSIPLMKFPLETLEGPNPRFIVFCAPTLCVVLL